jgi:HSP20 family protein
MNSITRWDPFPNISSLQEQVNRLFESSLPNRGDNSALTTWAPAVDIYETENELVLKADVPDINEKDLDVRVEKNMLTIRGERKFEQQVKEDNYLRIERTYGSKSRKTVGQVTRPPAPFLSRLESEKIPLCCVLTN